MGGRTASSSAGASITTRARKKKERVLVEYMPRCTWPGLYSARSKVPSCRYLSGFTGLRRFNVSVLHECDFLWQEPRDTQIYCGSCEPGARFEPFKPFDIMKLSTISSDLPGIGDKVSSVRPISDG